MRRLLFPEGAAPLGSIGRTTNQTVNHNLAHAEKRGRP